MKLITKVLHHEQVKPRFSPMWKPQPLLHSHCAKLLDLIWKHMFLYEKHTVFAKPLNITRSTFHMKENIKMKKLVNISYETQHKYPNQNRRTARYQFFHFIWWEKIFWLNFSMKNKKNTTKTSNIILSSIVQRVYIT